MAFENYIEKLVELLEVPVRLANPNVPSFVFEVPRNEVDTYCELLKAFGEIDVKVKWYREEWDEVEQEMAEIPLEKSFVFFGYRDRSSLSQLELHTITAAKLHII